MTPPVDLLLVDPAGGADRQVTVPSEVRIDRLANRLAEHVHDSPGSGWGLRRPGQDTALPGERTLAEAGVQPGERIELIAPGAAAPAPMPPPAVPPVGEPLPPPPPPRSQPLPPPPGDGPKRSRGMLVVAVLAAVVLLAAGAAFAATRLLGGSDSSSTAAAPVEWGSKLGSGSEKATGSEAGSEEPEESEGEAETEPEGGEAEAGAESEIPEMSRSELRAEIGDLLLAHHMAIVEGEYRRAWELLSARKRRKYLSEGDGYPTWKKNQSTLAAYLQPQGLQVSILAVDRTEGVVTVRLSGMGWAAPGSPCSEWSGITWVKYERGGWYYDPGYSTTPSREDAWKSKYAKLLGGSC